MANVHQLNEKYYNNLYKGKNKFLSILYPFISYDQQSKSKANYSFIRKVIDIGRIRILDYGFGHGSFLLKFSKKATLFGVDISKEAVTNFPRTAEFFGKKVITSTPDNISKIIDPGSLDLICLSHVLEHVEDDKALLSQLCRFLNTKGYLLINVPINEVWNDPKHVRKYDFETMELLLSDLNLKIVEHFAFDKITAFFLEHEQNRRNTWFKKVVLRGMRLLLSFAPFRIYKLFDNSILRNYSNQQLIVLAKKK